MRELRSQIQLPQQIIMESVQKVYKNMLNYYLKRPELAHRLRFERAAEEYAKSVGRKPSTIRRRFHPAITKGWPEQWAAYQKKAERDQIRKLILGGNFDKLFDKLGIR